jgi:nucleotide-binding universal stress UspA family protein
MAAPIATVTSGRRIRRSCEAGHTPKLLVLVDDALDCGKAVYYAARRAARIGAKLVLLRVIEPSYPELDWLGVGDIIETEQQQEAQLLLDNHVRRAQDLAVGLPETVIRKGETSREILKLIQADEDIAILVLAAGPSSKGQEPLVSDLARSAGTYPIPVVIVPAHLIIAPTHRYVIEVPPELSREEWEKKYCPKEPEASP